jgi:hypothetical protein
MKTKHRIHDDDSNPQGGDSQGSGGNLGQIRSTADELVTNSRAKIDNLLDGGQSTAFLAGNRQRSAQ